MEKEKKKSKVKVIIPIVAVVIIVVVVGIVVLTSKDTGTSIFSNKTYYHIGDTVSTDIAEFTLNNSALTIALERGDNENFYTPKEYNAEEDRRNPYLADTGHTLAYFDFTLCAYDRSDIELETRDLALGEHSFVNVTYNGKKYSDRNGLVVGREKKIDSLGTLVTKNGKDYIDTSGIGNWKDISSSYNILLLAGNKSQFRGYYQIPVEVENLQDEYYITFKLPNSKGKTQEFTYIINEK